MNIGSGKGVRKLSRLKTKDAMDPLEQQLKEAEKIIKDYEYVMAREPHWHEAQ